MNEGSEFSSRRDSDQSRKKHDELKIRGKEKKKEGDASNEIIRKNHEKAEKTIIPYKKFVEQFNSVIAKKSDVRYLRVIDQEYLEFLNNRIICMRAANDLKRRTTSYAGYDINIDVIEQHNINIAGMKDEELQNRLEFARVEAEVNGIVTGLWHGVQSENDHLGDGPKQKDLQEATEIIELARNATKGLKQLGHLDSEVERKQKDLSKDLKEVIPKFLQYQDKFDKLQRSDESIEWSNQLRALESLERESIQLDSKLEELSPSRRPQYLEGEGRSIEEVD